MKLYPVRVKDKSGSSSLFLQSIVYCPLKLFFAPISLFLFDVKVSQAIAMCGLTKVLKGSTGERSRRYQYQG